MSVKLRNKLGGLKVEDTYFGDALAIVLGIYFSSHLNRPDNDPLTERGWGEWVENKTDEALDLIAKQLAL